MHITKIQLNNFRNYETAEISPCPGVTVLYGNNAQGKTALVESVILCCTGRSHRTPRDKELIRWEQPGGHVRVEVERNDGPHEIDLTLSPTARKIVKIGGRTLQRTGELMGHLNGVLFAPEDLRIVKDGPAERRRFIDMELSQIRPGYYYALQLYNRALNQRNHLLREIPVKPSLRDTLDDLAGAFGEARRISLCRELTKLHEEVIRTTLGGAIERYAQQQPRGEYVLILEGAAEVPAAEITLEDALARVAELIAEGRSKKDAVKQAAAETGFPKNTLYDAAIRQ